jgi:hypothetical protein
MERIAMQRIAKKTATTTNITSWKASAIIAVIALALCAAGPALAAKPQGKSGGGGGGGGGHSSGGGGAHFGGGGGAHFSGGGGTHFSGGGTHFAAPARVTPRFSGSVSKSHVTSNVSSNSKATSSKATSNVSSNSKATSNVSSNSKATSNLSSKVNLRTNAGTNLARTHAAGGADPAAFLAHRHFAGGPAFRPFLGHGWHPYHHLGWVGPLFWPYAYGDLFYCSLWPGDYCGYDPFWAYGYGDLYESIFSPYDYAQYVQGPNAPAQMASLTQGMAESCDDEAAEVTGWPINQIQDAVQPNQQQSALLDNLGNAIVKASAEIKSNCPTTVAFAPTDRLGQMQVRLQSLVDAVNTVEPPLTQFYDSLSDEQKARFNDIAPPAPPPTAQNGDSAQSAATPPTIQAQCGANVMAWPGDKIDQVVKPDDAQSAKLQALQSAVAQAGDAIKAACPSDMPATPPSRLGAIGKRLNAMLQAVQTVQPALADFYNSLSDDQKARFNNMGQQLFAQNQQ